MVCGRVRGVGHRHHRGVSGGRVRRFVAHLGLVGRRLVGRGLVTHFGLLVGGVGRRGFRGRLVRRLVSRLVCPIRRFVCGLVGRGLVGGSVLARDLDGDRRFGVPVDDAHGELVLAGRHVREVHPDNTRPVEVVRSVARALLEGDVVDLLVRESRGGDLDIVRPVEQPVDDVQVEHALGDRFDGVRAAVPEPDVQRVVLGGTVELPVACVCGAFVARCVVAGVLCGDGPRHGDSADGGRKHYQSDENERSMCRIVYHCPVMGGTAASHGDRPGHPGRRPTAELAAVPVLGVGAYRDTSVINSFWCHARRILLFRSLER